MHDDGFDGLTILSIGLGIRFNDLGNRSNHLGIRFVDLGIHFVDLDIRFNDLGTRFVDLDNRFIDLGIHLAALDHCLIDLDPRLAVSITDFGSSTLPQASPRCVGRTQKVSAAWRDAAPPPGAGEIQAGLGPVPRLYV